jgi:hypothetical protein
MKYQNIEWTISELISNVRNGKLNLSPEYQRNPVWRSSAQTRLIESVLNGRPIPSFFIRDLGAGKFEMVDGQQRARAIIGYFENIVPDEKRLYFEQRVQSAPNADNFRKIFFEYKLSITVIKTLDAGEEIEPFYALLNSSGLRLNRPELRKAEYYGTKFLQLIRSAIEYPAFQELELFDQYSISRMTDFEVASEILAQFKFGPFDKKEKVDQLFEDDISEQEESHLMESFAVVFDILIKLDQHSRVKRCRLRQKADLYTYAYFVHTLARLPYAAHFHFYQVFLKIAPHIKPSNLDCEPLREYAHNCVTQSNSKKARITRFEILRDILTNESKTPNKRQQQILDYFQIPSGSMVEVEGYLSLNFSSLKDPKQAELEFKDFLEDAF